MRTTPTIRLTALGLALALMSGCPAAQTPTGGGTPKPVGKRSTAGKLESPSPSPTATPTGKPTDGATATPTPTPTPTATATTDGTASGTATPTPTPTATPTATPTPAVLKVSTVAGVAAEPGSAEGLGANADGTDKGVARFKAPTALAFDKNGALLVADAGNHKIRKLVFDGAGRATVSTLAGSTSGDSDNDDPLQAQFKSPGGLAVDPANNDVYVADTGNQKIKRISASTGKVHVIAGTGSMGVNNGAADQATFTFPRGLVLDGGKLYVTDTEGNQVRMIDVAGDNTVSTFVGAGGTIAPDPGLTFPYALAIGPDKALYLAEQGSSTVRKIKDGAVTTLAGTSGSTGYADAAATAAKFDFFNNGAGLAVGSDGTVYVADSGNVVIRAIAAGKVTTFAGSRVYADETNKIGLPPGDGPASAAKFNAPIAIVLGADKALYVADRDNNCIRRIK